MDSPSGGLGTPNPGRPEKSGGLSQRNAVAGFYQTWWISPDGIVHDAVRDGAPGHCAWLMENFSISSRSDARRLGWVRVGWNLTRFYVDGRPDRIDAHREAIQELLLGHPMVTEVLLEVGSDLDSVMAPEEFLNGGR